MKTYKLTIGTKLKVNVDTSLATATGYYLMVMKPNGEVRLPATGNCTKESDTQLSYTFAANDIDVAGDWHVQPVITMPNFTGRFSTADFEITENYK